MTVIDWPTSKEVQEIREKFRLDTFSKSELNDVLNFQTTFPLGKQQSIAIILAAWKEMEERYNEV